MPLSPAVYSVFKARLVPGFFLMAGHATFSTSLSSVTLGFSTAAR